MGAAGGVVWIPVRDPKRTNHARVMDLLKPFWQFTDLDGPAFWAEEGHSRWFDENPAMAAPDVVIGLYGDDRGDNLNLNFLARLCDTKEDRGTHHLDELYELTFDELDLDCRTTYESVTGSHYDHPLHMLWYQHFKYAPREEVLRTLGPIGSMRIVDWASELRGLLHFDLLASEETWT